MNTKVYKEPLKSQGRRQRRRRYVQTASGVTCIALYDIRLGSKPCLCKLACTYFGLATIEMHTRQRQGNTNHEGTDTNKASQPTRRRPPDSKTTNNAGEEPTRRQPPTTYQQKREGRPVGVRDGRHFAWRVSERAILSHFGATVGKRELSSGIR